MLTCFINNIWELNINTAFLIQLTLIIVPNLTLHDCNKHSVNETKLIYSVIWTQYPIGHLGFLIILRAA
jgi:hypothetical protein